jgi:predicted flap endonuclease-1-like 5' DNA nuclease
MTKLTNIEGVGEAYARKLRAADISSITKLLEEGATPKGRKKIAIQSGLSDTLISKWVNHADLFRVKGIGSEYAELLEISGVDTVVELAQRNPTNLHQKMTSVNQEKRLVRKLPALVQVEKWVTQAKKLPRVIKY